MGYRRGLPVLLGLLAVGAARPGQGHDAQAAEWKKKAGPVPP